MSRVSVIALNWVDLAALAIIAFEVIAGLRRKLAGELFRLISTILILAIAWRYYFSMGEGLASLSLLSSNTELAVAIAFTLIVIFTGTISAVLHFVLGFLMKVLFKPKLDRIGGAVAGFARGYLIVTIALFAAALWPGEWFRQTFRENTLIGAFNEKWTPKTCRFLQTFNLTLQHEPHDQTDLNQGQAEN